MVKNPPAMWETWVQSLGWDEPLEEGMATNSSILAWRIPMDREAWQATLHGVAKKSDATEWLRTILSKTIRSQRGGAAHRGENYRWRPLVICLSIQLHLVSCYSGSLQSMRTQRVEYDWVTKDSAHIDLNNDQNDQCAIKKDADLLKFSKMSLAFQDACQCGRSKK